ncbi:Adhesion G protein-coupled receptor B3 [Acipenser ruthenus]|uniref:Adhesion G protein-coupled receptor B3 n=1 Tax=Acipenser ruthenus TaxID=7906 RepID=A0A444UAZ9_ACIRT|nr:Adhesion G protein-coupled receptor B3 [Acipenser ruthenus]
MSQVTKTLLDLTQRKNFYAGDLLASVEVLRNVTDTFKRASYVPSSDDVQNFFQIISNLLEEENREKWKDAQQIYPGSVELMMVIEDFIHIVGLGMKDFHNSYLMTGNLVASIQKLPAASVLTDINFPMKGRKGMVDWARNSEDKVVIPKGLFTPPSTDLDESSVFILGTVLYKNLGLILPSPRVQTPLPDPQPAQEDALSLAASEDMDTQELIFTSKDTESDIFSLPQYAPPYRRSSPPLSDVLTRPCWCLEPWKMSLNALYLIGCLLLCVIACPPPPVLPDSIASLGSMNPYCALWDTNIMNDSWGFWSTKGCKTVLTDASHTKCLCDRLSTFAILAQQPREIVYKIRKINNINKLLLVNHLLKYPDTGWTDPNTKSGLPALVVAISMGFTKAKGYGTPQYCWLSLEGGLLYAFVGPAAAVVLVNMVIGILVFNKLVSRDGILDKKLKHRAGQMSEPHAGLTLKCAKCGVVSTTALSATTASNAMASLWSSCVVLPLLALTWMSAVLAMTDKRSILFQILFAVFDSLQGFVIVMVHCILRKEVQDAFRCRLRNCQDPINADTAGTFPNGHAQIMTDFEKDVDIACRSVLHKDLGPCRAATITGTLSRISLNDDEDEKGPEGMSYSNLPGNFISKVLIQQPSGLHMPIGMNERTDQCINDSSSDLRRTVYLCTDDNLRAGDAELMHPQGQMMESDYIVMPRGSANAQSLMKDESKLNIGMDTLPHERLMHYKVNPEFNINAPVMDHINMNLNQQFAAQEQMQNIQFEPRTAVKNFLAEMEENAGLSRSETGSTISMSSLEKVMHTRKRHMELFQELNQKFQTLDRFQDIPNMGSMEKATPNKNPWDSYSTPCEYQNYATMNALETDAKDSLEMTPAEWEKCISLPLDVQEGDFQTEV